MKTNGQWQFDQQMIDILEIQEVLTVYEESYGKKSSKAMTAAVVNYLKSQHPEKQEEYKLIYRKANNFLIK